MTDCYTSTTGDVTATNTDRFTDELRAFTERVRLTFDELLSGVPWGYGGLSARRSLGEILDGFRSILSEPVRIDPVPEAGFRVAYCHRRTVRSTTPIRRYRQSRRK